MLSAGGGGITGFKYIEKTGRFSYKTKASGILLGQGFDGNFELTNAYIIHVYRENESAKPYIFGVFTKNAAIASSSNTTDIYIFEFI